MKKLLLVLFSAVLLFSCSAEEVSREGSGSCDCVEVEETSKQSENYQIWRPTGDVFPTLYSGCSNDGLIVPGSLYNYEGASGEWYRVRRKVSCE